MNFAEIIIIFVGLFVTACLLAVILGPSLGWRIAARHEELIAFSSRIEAREKIRGMFSDQGWEIERDGPGGMTARTKASWRSWGEVVKVEFQDGGAMVSSQCLLPTQAIDYGKNRMNVQKLVDTLKSV